MCVDDDNDDDDDYGISAVSCVYVFTNLWPFDSVDKHHLSNRSESDLRIYLFFHNYIPRDAKINNIGFLNEICFDSFATTSEKLYHTLHCRRREFNA